MKSILFLATKPKVFIPLLSANRLHRLLIVYVGLSWFLTIAIPFYFFRDEIFTALLASSDTIPPEQLELLMSVAVRDFFLLLLLSYLVYLCIIALVGYALSRMMRLFKREIEPKRIVNIYLYSDAINITLRAYVLIVAMIILQFTTVDGEMFRTLISLISMGSFFLFIYGISLCTTVIKKES